MLSGSGRQPADEVFVGRTAELAMLRAAWESARGGSARVVAVEGDPGMGKHALVEQLLSQVSAPIVRVSGVEAESLMSWGVLHELAVRLPGGQMADMALTLEPQADPLFVGQRLAQSLQSGTELLVVVEHAQWADPPSMATLRYAARRLRYDPVLLIVTYRPRRDADGTGPAGLPAGWRQVVDGEHGIYVPLTGLPPEDVLRLAASRGFRGLSPQGAARLHASTGGNPGHVLELLRLLSMRSIAADSGPLPVPRDFALAITSRLASCKRQARELVIAGAVLGQRFSVAELRSVTGADVADEHIAEVTRAGLLAEVPGTGGRELTFPQVLTREVIYHDLSRNVRSGLHRRCASLGGPAALRHRIDAADGVDEQLAADLRRAAADRLASHDIPRAAFYLHRALDCTAPGPGRLSLVLAAVESLLAAGDAIAAREYEGELTRAPAGPWRDYVLGYQLLLAGRVDESTALLRGALTALERGEQTESGAPPDLRARIATQLAIVGIVMLDYHAMLKFGSIAVDAGSDEPWVRGFAWFAKAVGMTLSGAGSEALTLLAGVSEPGAAPGLEGLTGRGLIRLWTDDLDGAAQDLHTTIQRATRGEALRISQALGFLGEVEYRRGRLGESVLFTSLAVGNAEENDRVWDYPVLHALACYPHAARAAWDRAEQHANESATWARLIGSPAALAFAAGARAAIAQARGDAERLLVAADEIEEHYDSLEPGTHLFGPVRADALAQLGRPDEATEALAPFLAGLVTSGRRSAQMSAERVAAQIALAREDPDLATRHCERAAALARVVGLPLEEARIGLVAARGHSLAGRHAAAERALRAARKGFVVIGADAYRRLADRLAASLGIALNDRPDPFAGLTRREHDIALLVCQGLTNKEIAARLYLSVKTVETHLLHAFAKLDVSSRAELKVLLDQAG